MRKLILLISLIVLWFTGVSQNTSPLVVKDFMLMANGIFDIDQVPKDARTDWDSNPVCMIAVKAVGFNENLMQKFTFVPNGMEITTPPKFKNGQMILYVSSKKLGELTIKYMGELTFRLPYPLEPSKIYELTLGMETATLVIRTIPTDADIFVDNNKVGTGEAINAVSIGTEHRYRVVREDYYTQEGQVYFEKREEKSINITLEPNFGYITIKTEPAGADVFVDDVKVGVTPYLTKKIKLGTHVVELRKTGCESYSDMVDIKAKEVNKQLENVKLTAVQVPTGTLELTTNPTGAVVTINGRQYGQTPQTLTGIEVGTYIIDFSKEGYQNLQQTVTVKDSKKETLNVTLSKVIVPQQPVPTTPVTPTTHTSPTATTTSFGNRTFTVNGVTFEMIAVKGGTFTMGGTSEQGNDAESDEKPTHSVTLSDYYIGKFEVTQELWQAVMGNNPSYFEGTNLPVEQVSWNDIQDFIRKLNQKTGANFHLPTEAEWEYAARGGNKGNGYKYSGSNNIGSVAWYTDNSGNKTHPVGQKTPNELGIYDMSGNVYEWCQDWYGDYSSGSQINPKGPSLGWYRVLRGGSWNNNARNCRVSNRNNNNPDNRNNNGFRLVLVP